MVTTQQERVIGEREGALNKLRLELETVRLAAGRKDEEVRAWGPLGVLCMFLACCTISDPEGKSNMRP